MSHGRVGPHERSLRPPPCRGVRIAPRVKALRGCHRGDRGVLRLRGHARAPPATLHRGRARRRRAGCRPQPVDVRVRRHLRPAGDRAPRHALRAPARDGRRLAAGRRRRVPVRHRRRPASAAGVPRPLRHRGGRPVRGRGDARRRPRPAAPAGGSRQLLLRRRVRRPRRRADHRRGRARRRSLPPGVPRRRGVHRARRRPVARCAALRGAGGRRAGARRTRHPLIAGSAASSILRLSGRGSSWRPASPPSRRSRPSFPTTPARSASAVRAPCSPPTAWSASCCASSAPACPSGSVPGAP